MKSFFVVGSKGRFTAYGPFDSDLEAARAGYFHKSVAERDAAAASKNGRVFLLGGVNAFDDRELETIRDYPSEAGYKSFKVLPPSKLRIHKSWLEISPSGADSSLEWLRDGDFEAWWRR